MKFICAVARKYCTTIVSPNIGELTTLKYYLPTKLLGENYTINEPISYITLQPLTEHN